MTPLVALFLVYAYVAVLGACIGVVAGTRDWPLWLTVTACAVIGFVSVLALAPFLT